MKPKGTLSATVHLIAKSEDIGPRDMLIVPAIAPLHSPQKTIAIAVLGKALHEGQLTQEGKARVFALVRLLRRLPKEHRICIIFTGHRGEAAAMRQFFHRHELSIGHEQINICEENHATNTLENATNVCRLCQENFLQPDEIYLVTCGYHLKRMILSWNFSMYKSELNVYQSHLPGTVLHTQTAPYPFLRRNQPRDLRSSAQLYVQTHALTPVIVWMLGAAEGRSLQNLDTVRKYAFKEFNRLNLLAHTAQIEHVRVEPAVSAYFKHQRDIHHVINWLNSEHVLQVEPEDWRNHAATLGFALNEIRQTADPDRQAS